MNFVHIKQIDHFLFLVYQQGDKNFKAKVSSHSDNSFIKITQYEGKIANYGQLYLHDGSNEKLDALIRKFDPQENDVNFLIECLSVHLNLRKQNTFYDIIGSIKKFIWNCLFQDSSYLLEIDNK